VVRFRHLHPLAAHSGATSSTKPIRTPEDIKGFKMRVPNAPILFLALLTGPALNYADDQWIAETPALGLPETVRAAAVPAGCILPASRWEV
jgi:Bacterial extracellular solute-binding protein, family 7